MLLRGWGHGMYRAWGSGTSPSLLEHLQLYRCALRVAGEVAPAQPHGRDFGVKGCRKWLRGWVRNLSWAGIPSASEQQDPCKKVPTGKMTCPPALSSTVLQT